MSRAARLLLGLSISLAALQSPTLGARVRRPDKPVAATPSQAPPPSPPATPAAPPADSRPYDAQLMRLAELLGALTTMRQLCGASDAGAWHDRMQALIATEGSSPERKDRLAGAYNRGLEGYALTYRSCTANARLVVRRYLEESSHLAHEIGNRYRAS